MKANRVGHLLGPDERPLRSSGAGEQGIDEWAKKASDAGQWPAIQAHHAKLLDAIEPSAPTLIACLQGKGGLPLDNAANQMIIKLCIDQAVHSLMLRRMNGAGRAAAIAEVTGAKLPAFAAGESALVLDTITASDEIDVVAAISSALERQRVSDQIDDRRARQVEQIVKHVIEAAIAALRFAAAIDAEDQESARAAWSDLASALAATQEGSGNADADADAG